MSFFDQIYERLFGNQQQPDKERKKTPFVTEPLKRTQQEQQFYFKWVTGKAYQSTLSLVAGSYRNALLGEPSQIRFRLLNEPSAKGFGVVYDPMIPSGEFKCLQDFFRDKVKGQGYRQYVAERRSFDEPNQVRVVEKYYLKPPIKDLVEGEPIDQQFGNILIEGHYSGHSPSYIKLMATTYSDRLYHPPRPFTELVSLLFEQDIMNS
jgi:hypothetical protein